MMSSGFTWSDFYLSCFAVGFCFSFLSFLFGGSRFGRLHLPHFHGHGVPHLPAGQGMAGHAPAAPVPAAGHAPANAGSHAPAQPHAARGGVSPFNPPTMAAFLAWFGGTGYLLTRYSALWVGFELLLSVAVGLIGGGIVFVFLTKVLISTEENMDPADYEMVGVLGRLAVSIRKDGTGELIYSQAGTRRVCGARSEDGSAIEKGTEVVVTRYEKGIAYVRLWSEMSGDE
ncbi:MAG TPA: hypothetical protein VJ999_04890 [Candidatus Sulfotelmatobacter sp.]|nr:hypothetical protein [Candidatus Sulfotelmatobacter sp.]